MDKVRLVVAVVVVIILLALCWRYCRSGEPLVEGAKPKVAVKNTTEYDHNSKAVHEVASAPRAVDIEGAAPASRASLVDDEKVEEIAISTAHGSREGMYEYAHSMLY